MMDQIGHYIGDTYRGVAKSVMGVLKESKFYTDGVLTPEEFLKAGDFLTQKCPTWKWCAATDKKLQCDYLPENKQYLMTSQVPCPKRANESDISKEKSCERIVEGDWVESTIEFYDRGNNKEALLVDVDGNDSKKTQVIINNDLIKENFMDVDVVEEVGNSINCDGVEVIESNEVIVIDSEDYDNIIHTRSYDVSISYDYYYRVPRIWLVGYSENGSPLQNNEINEDIMVEYIDRTVTIEKHPHTGMKSVSIHPCHHSDLIKKMIENFENVGKKLDVELSIVLFLKFLHSIVPTIQYDFTMNIDF